MKSRIKQQGSAVEITIIVILVVAVIGLLGFTLWQNIVNKPNTDTTKTSNENTGKTLTISEWGIKGTYESVEKLEYKTGSYYDGAQSVELTSLKIAEIGGDCYPYVGPIVRYSGDTMADIGTGSTGNPELTAKDIYDTMEVPNSEWGAKAHIGDYYYFLKNPQDGCTVNLGQRQELNNIRAAAKEFLLSAKVTE